MARSVVIRALIPVDATLAAIRDTDAELVVVIVAADLPAAERAMLIAAIAPLAMERAPGRRLCALDVSADADQADVDAAIRFLSGATSTTGQLLAIGQRVHGPSAVSTNA